MTCACAVLDDATGWPADLALTPLETIKVLHAASIDRVRCETCAQIWEHHDEWGGVYWIRVTCACANNTCAYCRQG